MAVDMIPLDVLLGNPEKVSPQISPDGKRMSYIAPVDGVLNVWIGDVGKDNYAPVTKDTDRGIRGYAWCHDNEHLFYIQDQGGDENWRFRPSCRYELNRSGAMSLRRSAASKITSKLSSSTYAARSRIVLCGFVTRNPRYVTESSSARRWTTTPLLRRRSPAEVVTWGSSKAGTNSHTMPAAVHEATAFGPQTSVAPMTRCSHRTSTPAST